MLKNTTRNVYIVNNLKSDKIEQAILILKSGFILSEKNNYSLSAEAQKIIDDYITKVGNGKRTRKKKEKSGKNSLKYMLLIFLLLGTVGLMSYIFILGIINLI